jgi:hypothetical protein
MSGSPPGNRGQWLKSAPISVTSKDPAHPRRLVVRATRSPSQDPRPGILCQADSTLFAGLFVERRCRLVSLCATCSGSRHAEAFVQIAGLPGPLQCEVDLRAIDSGPGVNISIQGG